MDNTVLKEIEDTITTGYIRGIHEEQSRDLALKGFHKDFEMIVLKGGQVERVNVGEWLTRVEAAKKDNPGLWNAATACEFRLIDGTGCAAVAKMDVYKGDVHFSTDYMLLYKIDGEWKIVSKIFSVPGPSKE